MQAEQIIDQQKVTWNKFSSGWRKWDEFVMDFIKPAGDEIIRLLDLKDTDHVLDVASGTGEPALTIARVVKNGKVTLTDLSEEMLKIAEEKAKNSGLRNVEIAVCEAGNLPFSDRTFDAVSCRFGFMFFPDIPAAIKESGRVLKDGRRLATSVWAGPEKNPWIKFVMDIVKANVELPKPLPTDPGMFRLAEKGSLTRLFMDAGFKNIIEKETQFKFNIGTADAYWSYMNEVSVSMTTALKNAGDETMSRIKNQLFTKLDQVFPNGNIALDATATIVSGEKIKS